MKKIILTVAAVFAFGAASAQESKSASEVVFGVKAGYSNTNFGGDAETDAASNFYVGGLVDFHITEKFHIQPELLYSMEGADNEETGLDFLRIPIMGKFFVGEGFNIQAGPQFGFVVGGDAIKDGLKSFDYGLAFGAAYELSSGLFFDARYNLGLADLNDTPIDAKINANSLNVGLGYRF